jgi:hypothetical protein
MMTRQALVEMIQTLLFKKYETSVNSSQLLVQMRIQGEQK